MNLEDILEGELLEAVREALPEDTELIVNDGSYIPRERLNDKNEEIQSLKDQIQTHEEQMKQLKNDSQASGALKKKIEELEDERKQIQQNYRQKLREQQIEKELIRANAREPKAVRPLLDEDAIEIDDDGIKGLEEQIEQLREEKSFLFAEQKPTPSHAGSEGFGGNDDSVVLTRQQIEQMSEDEINENWEEIQRFLEQREG